MKAKLVFESLKIENMKTRFDYEKIDNITLEDVDRRDYPDFVDAYIASADYDGVPMTQKELDELNLDTDFVHLKVIERLF